MKIVKLIEWLLKHQRGLLRLCYLVLLLLVLGDWLWVDKEHAHTAVEHYFAFWAVFGFVACVAIIFVSKWFGHLGIMQDEDYYGD